MDDNELKRLLETQAAEIGRHVDKRVGAFAESTEASLNVLTRQIDKLAEATDSRFVELRRHFDVVAEQHEKRFDILNEAISSVAEQMRAGFEQVDEKIDLESSETRAMIRLSYAELDRRVRSLEDVVVKLQERVERLEETIH